jgi:AMP deaminase
VTVYLAPAPKPRSESRSSVAGTDISQSELPIQMATSPSSSHLARSPSSAALGSVGGADGLPEQKIFPGIVHERARKGNMHQ